MRGVVWSCAVLLGCTGGGPGFDGGAGPDAASSDAGSEPADAGAAEDAAARPDAGAGEPVLDPDIRLGPYRSARAILDRSIRSIAAVRDATQRYSDVPEQGQLIHVIAERLALGDRHGWEGRDALIDLALEQVDDLMRVSGRVIGGGPAFGLDRPWMQPGFNFSVCTSAAAIRWKRRSPAGRSTG